MSYPSTSEQGGHPQPGPDLPAEPSVGSLPIAGVGARIGGGLIDVLLLSVLFVVFAALFGETDADGGFSANLEGIAFLVYVLMALGYYAGMEATSGRTVGKMAVGTRVVGEGGAAAEAGPVLIRTLLRIVDGLLFYLVGLIAVIANQENRRLGDLAGQTWVVKDR